MTQTSEISSPFPPTSLVRSLALCAAIPLTAEREDAVAQVLNAWLPHANALSQQMSLSAFQTLVPATVFVHPALANEES